MRMPNPELANAGIAAGEREPAGRIGMREKRAVEIQPQPASFRPIDPALKVLRAKLIAVDRMAAESPRNSRADSARCRPGIKLNARSRSARSSSALRALPG